MVDWTAAGSQLTAELTGTLRNWAIYDPESGSTEKRPVDPRDWRA